MAIELLTGDDESILRAAVHERIRHWVGDGDRTLMVDDFDGDDFELRAAVDAAQTPPFLTEHRVVVVRGVGRFTADELTPLLGYLADPLASTHLVLVGGGGRLPKALTDAVKGAGGIVTGTSPPSRPKDRAAWVAEQAEGHGLRLDAAAANRTAGWLGDDVGRLDGFLATLASAYGPGHRLGTADVEPFLGDAGGVPPWDFTDAIDAGDAATALRMLHRMIDGGERHPLQIMAILHSGYGKLARLDGTGARSESDAAAAMGIKPGYPAKKALTTYGRLGSGGVQRAVQLLAAADLDLRGASDLDDRVVMEVLVARLARLSSRR
jgi:DNA polymerase III subunit delta